MQQIIADKLTKNISSKRFDRYRERIEKRSGSCSNLDCYAHYSWNIALSESLYTPLQALEVSLRNAIHNNACEYFGNVLWFDDPEIIVTQQHVKMVKRAKKTLDKNKKNLSPGRILAELSFGFWTGLFNKKYSRILWHPLAKKVFPKIHPKNRNREFLSKHLNKIKTLRNRVFHYEPIWYYYDLQQQHDKILEAIYWIEPVMKQLVFSTDKFPVCYDPATLESIRLGLSKLK